MNRENRLAELQERNEKGFKVPTNAEVFLVEEHENEDVISVFITDDGWAHHKMTFHKGLVKQLISKLHNPDIIELKEENKNE